MTIIRKKRLPKKEQLRGRRRNGFSLVEIILASALFVIFCFGGVTVALSGLESNRLGAEQTMANQYAAEGIEAVRSIKNQNWSNLADNAGEGVALVNGVWAFSGVNNTFDKYTRVITVTTAQRDGSGNIVASGGTSDPTTKKITSTVSWNVSGSRNDSVVSTTYLTNWQQVSAPTKGMLVYGDGGTTSDAIKYKTFDGTTWGAATATADVDGSTTTKALRAAKLYSFLANPVFDAATSATQDTGTSLSFSHTVGASSNRILLVALAYRAHNNPGAQATSVTYGGTPLVSLGVRTVSTDRDVELWYLLAPASGANTVAVTMSADPENMAVTAISYSNVNQANPLGIVASATGTATAESVTVTSDYNQVVLGVSSSYPNGLNNTITPDGTQRWSAITPTANIQSVGNEKPGAPSVTLNWTATQSFSWAVAAVPINGVTRNEKILVSRHYNGSAQFIYAQVYNGSTWGNVVQLSTWTATTFLDVQNFDGTYLANGQFMVIFSDNTVIPKARIWDGTTWQAQTSLTTLGTSQIPNYIVARSRPGTNEVMASFFTQGSSTTTAETISEYWSGSAWSAITTHATASVTNTKRGMDFAWSTNGTGYPTFGGLVYEDAASDTTIAAKIFQANGTGGGTWTTTAVQAGTQANALGVLSITAKKTAAEFMVCDKDGATTPTIPCRKLTYSGTTPTFVTPTNPIVGAATDTGVERSYHIAFDPTAGDPGVMFYSDNTSTPKYKKYTSSTTTWDSAATSIATTGFTPGIFKGVTVIPKQGGNGNDMMVLMADANNALYSLMWDGTNNLVYTTPAGKAFSQHGTAGSAVTEIWFDFVWDQN